MGDDIVDVEGLDEHLAARAELLLAALALLGLGQDVDVPAGELRGEPHVLPAPADGERELVVGHDDLDAALLLVHHHLGDLGRRERVDDEGRGIGRPGNDVDLLALEFGDHRLHARAAHADAGADRIDAAVVGDDGDLGARARIARDRADLDDAVIDFRHFLGEQLGHELRMGARQEDLRAAHLLAHVVDVGAHALALAEALARQQLVAAQDRLGAAEIDDDVAELDALDEAVDDLADAVLELVELALALGVAHLLHDDLLRRLRGDAAEIDRRQRIGEEVADLGLGIEPARLGEGICVASFSTGSATSRKRIRRISPFLRSISARMSYSWPYFERPAFWIACSIACSTSSRSMPLSRATVSATCRSSWLGRRRGDWHARL